MHQCPRNEGAPDRIWLIAGHAGDGVADILRATGAEVTVTALDTERAESNRRAPRSIVVLDSVQTGRALADAVGRACAGRSERRLILITERAGRVDLRALLRAGAGAVVFREEMSRTLAPAVAAVASGQVCLPGQEVIAARRPVLSMREKQVLGLAAMGLRNVEIAERLFLAESTVKSHLSAAFAKLGVRSRHEAVEVLLNPASGLGVGILSLDEAAIPADSNVADLQ